MQCFLLCIQAEQKTKRRISLIKPTRKMLPFSQIEKRNKIENGIQNCTIFA